MRRMRQSINQPRRHGSQCPQFPPNQPTTVRRGRGANPHQTRNRTQRSRRHTYALAGAPAHHASADCVDHAGDLVPRDAREGEVGPLPFDRETVAVADTADLDADADLAPRWLGYVALVRGGGSHELGKAPHQRGVQGRAYEFFYRIKDRMIGRDCGWQGPGIVQIDGWRACHQLRKRSGLQSAPWPGRGPSVIARRRYTTRRLCLGFALPAPS
jgi:hypothetical protein